MATEIGTLAVRRSIWINAKPDRVWQEFESFERMRSWFGTGHALLKYEPRVGGEVLLEVEVEGTMRHFGGKVTDFEPGRELTFEDAWIPNEGWDAPMLLTLRLTAALGGTLVELFVHSIERIGEGAAEQHRGFERGWSTTQLEALRQIVEA